MSLGSLLGIAVVSWPILLGTALVDRFDGHPSIAGDLVYAAASRVCHQRPERSFLSQGQPWPVCARCAGLYLAAPFGLALAAVTGLRSRRRLTVLVAAAAVPVALTWGAEFIAGFDISGLVRAAAAAPLGAAIAAALIVLVAPSFQSNRID